MKYILLTCGLPILCALGGAVACNTLLGTTAARCDIDCTADAGASDSADLVDAPGRTEADAQPESSSDGPLHPCGEVSNDSYNCGVCGHDCLDGTCSAGVCQPVRLGDTYSAYNLQVDKSPSGWLYWASWEQSAHGGTYRISKTLGALPQQIYAVPLGSYDYRPIGIALQDTRVCWSVTCDNAPLGLVSCADLDGRNAIDIGANPDPSMNAYDTPWTLAADATNAYWTILNDNQIWTAPLDGSAKPTQLPLTPAQATATDRLYTLAVDPGTEGNIYWTDGNQLLAAGKDGTGAQALYTQKSASEHLIGAVAVTDTEVYWFMSYDDQREVLAKEDKLPTSGYHCAGSVGECPILLGQDPYVAAPGPPVFDGDYVYWSNNGNGTISRARTDGTETVTLVSGQLGIVSVAIDAAAIYWVTSDAGGVFKLAK